MKAKPLPEQSLKPSHGSHEREAQREAPPRPEGPFPGPRNGATPAKHPLQSASTVPEMAAIRPRLPSLTDLDSLPRFFDVEEEDTQVESRAPDDGNLKRARTHAMRAVLMRMDGVTAGQVQAIESDELTIGRNPSCDISVDDSGISRQHVRLRRHEGTHELVDLDSRNGTYVMGRRVQRALLEDGDWIQLGPRICFRYSQIDSRHEQVLRELYDASTKDPLTGAFNRKYFGERLRAEVAFAQRHKTPTSLLLVDVDHFKKVNDTIGHAAGDAVLRQVARVIMHRLRTEDLFARFGGEEFVVILRGTEEAGAVRVAERLRATIAAVPAVVSGAAVPVTVSIGCATLGGAPEMTGDALIAIADRRLYRAKALGRNRVVGQD